jgi:hypothetical protein
MLALAQPLTLRNRSLVWAAVALVVGLVLNLLPLQTSVLLLGLTILIILSLIDIRVALFVTLVLAPLKILTETEIPLARELPVDIGQIAFFATLGIWVAHSIASRRHILPRWSPIYLPLILFLVAATLSIWNSALLWSTLKELVQFAEILVIAALGVSLMETGNIRWIVAALIASGVVQALLGVYQFRGGSGAPSLWILDFRYFRAFGSFGQPNPFGAFMGLILALSLGCTFGAISELWTTWRESQSDLARAYRLYALTKLIASRAVHSVFRVGTRYIVSLLLLIIADAILAVGLLVSWSRGAWLGFGGAALTLLFFAPKRRLIGAVLVALVVGGAIFIFATGLAPASLVARASDFTQDLVGYTDVRGAQISDANYAVLERLAHWQAALDMARDNLWIGIGFGAYDAAYPRYALMNWPTGLGHAHNFYLNVLAETGVIGLVAYLVAWIMIIILTLRVLNKETGFRRGIALGILGAWAHLAVHSLFDKLYVNNLPLHLGVMLGLIGGLLIYRCRNDEYSGSVNG